MSDAMTEMHGKGKYGDNPLSDWAKKYPEEIVKAAEKLIEEHTRASQVVFQTQITKKQALKAAIVSCEFALEYELNFDSAWKGVRKIKLYLEELL